MLEELTNPRSVLDVGCGPGAWMSEFDTARIVGIDEQDPSDVAGGAYRQVDLAHPFDVGRFDLALCLEVAEHIPQSSAGDLVASLANAAPVVAFSAAIPRQSGHGHINCQWPDYWAALFARHGYRQFDAFRSRLWDDERVAWWYRQNLFLYSAETVFPEERLPDRIVHPECLTTMIEVTETHGTLARRGSVDLVRALPHAITRSVRRRLPRRA